MLARRLYRPVVDCNTRRVRVISGCPFAAIVKATAPAVAPKTREIVDDFYPRMFKQNPETQAFFNKANQFKEPPGQRMALANAIVAYASNIEDLGPLTGAVELIAHKHCGLGVQTEHYSIVHKNLMESIGHVLGDVVTPEIGQGWSDAVLSLAKILYEKENELYTMAEARSGGWKGKKEFKITSVRDVTGECREFTFQPADGGSAPIEFTAGQFLTLHLAQHTAEATPRHYTITNAPGQDFLQCCIKKIDKGLVSNTMHGLKEGDVVQLSAPFGNFKIQAPDRQCVLMSAGIGATPMKCFLDAARDNVKFMVHVDKSEAAHPYLKEMKESGVETQFYHTESGSRPTPEELVEAAKSRDLLSADFYLCGPSGFLKSTRDALTAAGAKSVTIDVFGPELAMA